MQGSVQKYHHKQDRGGKGAELKYRSGRAMFAIVITVCGEKTGNSPNSQRFHLNYYK